MKERPILFSGPMVRAILEGRKTQTRRVMNPQPPFVSANAAYAYLAYRDKCPYGVQGDRLWVRETWTGTWHYNKMQIVYASTGEERFVEANSMELNLADYALPKAALKADAWVTPLFMPRWASRITLEITDVRVQRVQEISEEDALAEGIYGFQLPNGLVYGHDRHGTPGSMISDTARGGFYALWDSINAKRGFGWDANPWVWTLTFTVANRPSMGAEG